MMSGPGPTAKKKLRKQPVRKLLPPPEVWLLPAPEKRFFPLPNKMLPFTNDFPLISCLSDNDFKCLFRILMLSMQHEINNSISSINVFSIKNPKARKLAMCLQDRIIDSFRRLDAMVPLLEGADPSAWFKRHGERYNYKELALLGFNADVASFTPPASLDGARRIVSVSAAKFKDLLSAYQHDLSQAVEIRQDPLQKYHLDRIATFGESLCDCVQKLSIGDLSFIENRVRYRLDAKQNMYIGRKISEGAMLSPIPFRLAIDPALTDMSVYATPFSFLLIVTNILSNAKRASPDGKPMEISMFCNGKKLSIDFTDFGAGMPLDIMEKLNQGVSVSTKRADEGKHGLGFAFCRDFAERMGGKLYVKRSEPGIGTTVTIELEIAE